MTLWRSHFVRG